MKWSMCFQAEIHLLMTSKHTSWTKELPTKMAEPRNSHQYPHFDQPEVKNPKNKKDCLKTQWSAR